MSVTTTNSVKRYTGNGATLIFAYDYKIFVQSDLKVYVADAAGVDVLQVLGVDYTVSGAGVATGGNVTFAVAPPNGRKITIQRDLAVTQETTYPVAGQFPAQAHESALDKMTMLLQAFSERLGRQLTLLLNSTYTNLTVPDPVAGKYLRWKTDLTGLENVDSIVTAGALGLPVAIADGGTAATTAANARANLGLGTAALVNTPISEANGGTGKTSITVVGSAGLIKKTTSGASLDLDLYSMEEREVFYEDFTSIDGGTAAGAGAIRRSVHQWWVISQIQKSLVSSTWAPQGDGAGNNSRMWLSGDGSSAFMKNFTGTRIGGVTIHDFRISWGQVLAVAGTRRCGLMVAAPNAADPATGIYFRHAVDGAISLVCRKAGVETTLATGVTAAASTFFKLRFTWDWTTPLVTLYVNGTQVGTIGTNVPTSAEGPLGFALDNGASTLNCGSSLDYISIINAR